MSHKGNKVAEGSKCPQWCVFTLGSTDADLFPILKAQNRRKIHILTILVYPNSCKSATKTYREENFSVSKKNADFEASRLIRNRRFSEFISIHRCLSQSIPVYPSLLFVYKEEINLYCRVSQFIGNKVGVYRCLSTFFLKHCLQVDRILRDEKISSNLVFIGEHSISRQTPINTDDRRL